MFFPARHVCTKILHPRVHIRVYVIVMADTVGGWIRRGRGGGNEAEGALLRCESRSGVRGWFGEGGIASNGDGAPRSGVYYYDYT